MVGTADKLSDKYMNLDAYEMCLPTKSGGYIDSILVQGIQESLICININGDHSNEKDHWILEKHYDGSICKRC